MLDSWNTADTANAKFRIPKVEVHIFKETQKCYNFYPEVEIYYFLSSFLMLRIQTQGLTTGFQYNGRWLFVIFIWF